MLSKCFEKFFNDYESIIDNGKIFLNIVKTKVSNTLSRDDPQLS